MSEVTLQKHGICVNIVDRYATIIYSFDFENTRHHGSNELQFEITIDPESFISNFTAMINDELFYGITKEKEKAAQEYEEAKEKNENAILISQPYADIPNVFEIKTNMDANSKIALKITIEQYLQKRFNCNQLSIQILRNFDKYKIEQALDFISFDFKISDASGIYDIDMPLFDNNIIIRQNELDSFNKKCTIAGEISPKSSLNELVLKYKIKGESEESRVLFDAQSGTFCHIVSDIIANSVITNEDDVTEGHNDANVVSEGVLIPRRVVFVVDRSGSMSGSKWTRTISSTISALKQLRKQVDRYCIILFSSQLEIIPVSCNSCILADGKNITDAIQCLNNSKARGSTNINDALLQGIDFIQTDIKLMNDNAHNHYFMNQIILITDGEPNSGVLDPKQIILNVQKANHLDDIDPYNGKISIFSFGIGKDGNDSAWINDLNHSFLKILSLNNNGFYKRIKKSTADALFTEYFNILSTPILSNICIAYQSPHIIEVTQNKWHTFYAGNDLIIAGKINNKDLTQFNVIISALSATNIQKQEDGSIITKPIHIKKEINVVLNTESDTNHVQRIWAYLRLQQFAKNRLINCDMIEMDDDEKENEEEVPLALAMKYKFVTPWTSMIVVKEKDDESEAIVNYKEVQPARVEKEHKKKTKSLMLLQGDLFTMIVTTVFRNLEDEGIWIIDQSVRDKFNAKDLYEMALKEDIHWRQWNQWLRQKIVEYLKAHNMVNNQSLQPEVHQNDNNISQIKKMKDDEECLIM